MHIKLRPSHALNTTPPYLALHHNCQDADRPRSNGVSPKQYAERYACVEWRFVCTRCDFNRLRVFDFSSRSMSYVLESNALVGSIRKKQHRTVDVFANKFSR
jgi:hypothetical protein